MSHITIGSSPYGENCAQLGSSGYEERARVECRSLRNQLVRVYREAHDGLDPECRLTIMPHAHDFGTYYEVAAEFDDDNEAAVHAAYWIEANVPEWWDDAAREDLDNA